MCASPKSSSADPTAALLRRCSFPPAGTAVDVAVSGGADSLALLVLAVAAGCAVTAHHVDHGLRPGSAAEADLVRAAAERFGAGFVAHRVDVAPGPNLEARARAARYAALPAGVLTGHTADDQAETVLLNLLRGAGLDGLAGMAPERRPLLGLRRAETAALCRDLGLDVVHDPSNDDPAFRRNRVRHEVLPLLSEVARRDVVPILARQAGLLRDDARALEELVRWHTDAEGLPDAPALAGLPVAVARRVVRAWLRDAGGPERHPPDAAAVERVLAVARGEAVGCDVGGGWRVSRSKNLLRLHPPDS
ncbi:MAG TPA: tRNA lysidine(34) synthetase TilS [Acidimicrobiales bacterium]